jgi:hypothetical protein
MENKIRETKIRVRFTGKVLTAISAHPDWRPFLPGCHVFKAASRWMEIQSQR